MPKTDEQGAPCHDKRDNYCPVCGWDCEAHLRTPATDTEAMRLLMEAKGILEHEGYTDLPDRIDALAKGGA